MGVWAYPTLEGTDWYGGLCVYKTLGETDQDVVFLSIGGVEARGAANPGPCF